jgi:hypothetical protein
MEAVNESMETAARPEPKKTWFEPATALLMAAATLTTAWCSYQSSLWNEQSSGFAAQADVLQRQAFGQYLAAQQIESVQVQAFLHVTDAQLRGDEKSVRFYADRFGGTLKPAYEKWLALKPFENPAAPPHPFTPELYVPPFHQEILDQRAESAKLAAQSKTADDLAQGFLGNTVILAMALFFAGTASKFDQRHVRWSSLAFASSLYLYAAARMIMLHFVDNHP